MKLSAKSILILCLFTTLAVFFTACESIQVKSAKKESIVETAKGETEKGLGLWKGSWYGAGGPATVSAAPGELILAADGVDVSFDPDNLKNATVIFQNTTGSSRDSLMFKYNNVEGQDEKGEWGWISYCIAGGNPWEWAPQNITKCNALMFDIKADPPDNGMTFTFDDTAGIKTDEIKVNFYLPAGKITGEWQRVVIPFAVMGKTMDKFDRTSWKSMCGAFTAAGENTVYIDNVIAFEAGPNDLPESVRPMLELKIMEADPGKFLDTDVIFDFEADAQGWTGMDDEEYKATQKAVKWVSIDKAKIDPEDKAGHGKGVLAVDCTFSVSDFTRVAPVIKKEADWTGVKFASYDVYMPKDGIKTLSAVPFMQSDFWAKWAQADAKAKALVPGEWVTVQFPVSTMENLAHDTIDAIGTFIWGSVETPYTGPVYIDNYTIYKSKDEPAKTE